jgi:hypothetical protein
VKQTDGPKGNYSLIKSWVAGTPLVRAPEIRWPSLYEQLQYPVTAELYVDKVLDRQEFRKLCDLCVTRFEILRRLDGAAVPA